MADEEEVKPKRAMVKGATAEEIAALYESLTGRKPDVEKIRLLMAKREGKKE